MEGTGVYLTSYVRDASGAWKVKADFAHGDTMAPAK